MVSHWCIVIYKIRNQIFYLFGNLDTIIFRICEKTTENVMKSSKNTTSQLDIDEVDYV